MDAATMKALMGVAVAAQTTQVTKMVTASIAMKLGSPAGGIDVWA